MDRVAAILLTLAAGALVAFQPPSNSQLSHHVGALGATFVSLLISLTIIAALLLITGSVSDLGGIGGFQPQHALGGIAGAAIVAISLVTVKKLGASGVVAATICTQLIVSVILDRAGVLGLERYYVTPIRVIGIVLLIAGTAAVTSGR